MLGSAGADMGRVLDLYAGTGSFGIEALSRGAGWVDFVEMDQRHCSAIKSNLSLIGMQDLAQVYCQSVERALGSVQDVYGVVFLDPPYSEETLDSVMEKLTGSPVTGEDTIIVVEHSKRRVLADSYGKFSLVKARRYGETMVSMYQQEVIS